MKKFFVILVVLLVAAGCATRRETGRTTEGALVGGAVGYIIANEPGAWVGGALGAGLGHALGAAEDDAERAKRNKQAFSAPTPLPWLYGERVSVDVRSGWGESLHSVIEDELRGRGAIVVSSTRRYRRSDDIGAAFIVVVDARNRGDIISVSIRVIDSRDDVVRAIGDGRAWRNRRAGCDYDAHLLAARMATRKLH